MSVAKQKRSAQNKHPFLIFQKIYRSIKADKNLQVLARSKNNFVRIG